MKKTNRFKNSDLPKVLYIAGAGRSGSTLLDIIIGNHPNYFSLGELMFLIPNGVYNEEYCSCTKKVLECQFWSKVLIKWQSKMEMSLKEYSSTQKKYLRNKKTLLFLKNYFFPSNQFNAFLRDTKLQYQMIASFTEGKVIVDSSKNPHRILLLKKIGIPIHVLRISRKFSGVLNSNNKTIEKDIVKGFENSMNPKQFSYVFVTWVLDNFLTRLMSIGIKSYHIIYENLVKNPLETLEGLVPYDKKFTRLIHNRGPFLAQHLVAGNAVRMSEEIRLSNNPLNEMNRLKPGHRFFSKIIDACQFR